MTDMSVANTILAQLGGNKFRMMTGTTKKHSLVSGENKLQITLPRGFAKNTISKVIITLNALDLYDIEFGKVNRNLDWIVISKCENVYAEDLQRIFTAETGLDTHLYDCLNLRLLSLQAIRKGPSRDGPFAFRRQLGAAVLPTASSAI